MASPQGQSYTINGIKVYFPFKAYPSQLSMMDKIIKGIERKQNCLLESPTGSGKSLALLCSALAWQEAEQEKNKMEQEDMKKEPSSECCCNNKLNSPGGQLDQSHYFSSADQMPPPPPLGTVQTPIAVPDIEDDDFKPDKRKVRGQVPYQNGTDSPCGTTPGTPSWSVEVSKSADPVSSEQNQCGCQCGNDMPSAPKKKVPKIYFGTRTHKQIAQIAKELGRTAYKHVRMTILSSREHTCIDPEVSRMSHKNEECKNKKDGPGCRYFERSRKISHRSIRDNGLDTAWDLEKFVSLCENSKACPYYGARALKDGADIVFCPYNYLVDPLVRESMEIYLKGQIVILDEAHNIEDSSRDSASFSITQIKLQEAMVDLDKMAANAVKPAEHGQLYRMINSVNGIIDRNLSQLEGGNDYDQASKVFSGADIIAQLKHSGVGPDQLDDLKKCFAAVTEDDADPTKRGQNPGDDLKLKASTKQALEGLFMVLGYIYKDNMKYLQDYRIAIIKIMVYENINTNNRWLSRKNRGHRQASVSYSLNFWCLNPAVAFSDISDVVRSVVLTSGTLAPMNTFQSELAAPFPIQLEANHVIGASQVWVGTISRGPRGTPLLGTYQHTETLSYQDELGDVVLRVCQNVPHGVLCFVSSYKNLEKLSNRWKQTGLWKKITDYKVIMTEPRASDKEEFDALLRHFYEIISNSEQEDEENGGVTGALFLAVCRGKVSEGLDFADNNARAVIAVGIPFPSIKDTQIELKKQYNDEHSTSRGLLRGRDWYEIQAYRAINQALGRCIRHRHDWGALILVDERYAKNPQRYTKGLSKWVRQKVQYYSTFQQAEDSLKSFTKNRLENPVNSTNLSIMGTQSPSSIPKAPETPNYSIFTPFRPQGAPSTSTPLGTPSVKHEIHAQQQNTPSIALNTPQAFKATGPSPPIVKTLIKVPNSDRQFLIEHSADMVPAILGENVVLIPKSKIRLKDGKEMDQTNAKPLNMPSVKNDLTNQNPNPSSVQKSQPPPGFIHTSVNMPGSNHQIIVEHPADTIPTFSGQNIVLLPRDKTKSKNSKELNTSIGSSNPMTQLQFSTKGSSPQMNISQAGGFIPTQGSTQAVVSTQGTVFPTQSGLTQTQAGHHISKNTTALNQDDMDLTFKPPLASTQISGTPFCGASKDQDMPLDFKPPMASTQLTTTPGKTIPLESVTPLKKENAVAKAPDEPVFKTPKEKLKWDTPNSTKAESGKKLYKFVSLLKPLSTEKVSPSLANCRSDSPTLFDSDEESDQQISNVLKELGTEEMEIPTDNKQKKTKHINPSVRKPLFKRQTSDESKMETNSSIDNKVETCSDTKQVAPSRNTRRLSRSQHIKNMKNPNETMGDNANNSMHSKSKITSEKVEQEIKPESCKLQNSKDNHEGKIEGSSVASDIKLEPATEDDTLNTRRSSRNKRRRSGNTRLSTKRSRKSMGVDFSDEEDDDQQDEKKHEMVLTCPGCMERLAVFKDYTLETHRPEFVKIMKMSGEPVPYGGLIRVSAESLPEEYLTIISSSGPGPSLNSYYSSEDGCVVQLLGCQSCKTSSSKPKSKSSTHEPVCLGAHVLVLIKKNNPRLEEGQVWFLQKYLKT